MSKVLCDTKFLQLKETVSNDGNTWYYAHRPNADNVVVVLPVADDSILFLIEKRPPLCSEKKGKYSIGLPAGLVGDERYGESTEDAINAELLEETGLKAEKVIINADKVASSSGCLSETCTIATAYIKDRTIIKTPVDDGGIITDRVWVKKSDVRNWLHAKNKEGYVISAHTLAALFYFNEEGNI